MIRCSLGPSAMAPASTSAGLLHPRNPPFCGQRRLAHVPFDLSQRIDGQRRRPAHQITRLHRLTQTRAVGGDAEGN